MPNVLVPAVRVVTSVQLHASRDLMWRALGRAKIALGLIFLFLAVAQTCGGAHAFFEASKVGGIALILAMFLEALDLLLNGCLVMAEWVAISRGTARCVLGALLGFTISMALIAAAIAIGIGLKQVPAWMTVTQIVGSGIILSLGISQLSNTRRRLNSTAS